MWMRWIYRTLALFLGRKAWQAFQRRRGRSAGPPPPGAHSAR